MGYIAKEVARSNDATIFPRRQFSRTAQGLTEENTRLANQPWISRSFARYSNIIRVIDEFARNTRTTNGCAIPSSFSISYRNAKRFVTELRVYKGEVDEPREKLERWNGRREGGKFFPSRWKTGGLEESGHGIKLSDRICVSSWRDGRVSKDGSGDPDVVGL